MERKELIALVHGFYLGLVVGIALGIGVCFLLRATN